MTWKDHIFSSRLEPIKNLFRSTIDIFILYFFKDFIYLDRGERSERERERHISVREKHWSVASHVPPTEDLAHNPGMCPVQELNRWPFALWDHAQPNEPQQSGLASLGKIFLADKARVSLAVRYQNIHLVDRSTAYIKGNSGHSFLFVSCLDNQGLKRAYCVVRTCKLSLFPSTYSPTFSYILKLGY